MVLHVFFWVREGGRRGVSRIPSASTLPPALSSCHPCSMMPVDRHRCASLRVVSAVVGALRGWRRTSPCRSCQSRSLVCMTSATKHEVPCDGNSNLRPDSNIRGNFSLGAKRFAKHALTGHVAEAGVSAEELSPVFQSMVSVVHVHDTNCSCRAAGGRNTRCDSNTTHIRRKCITVSLSISGMNSSRGNLVLSNV